MADFRYDDYALSSTNGISIQQFNEETEVGYKFSNSIVGDLYLVGSRQVGGIKIRLSGDIYGSTASQYASRKAALKAKFMQDAPKFLQINSSREILCYVSRPIKFNLTPNTGCTRGEWEVELTSSLPCWRGTTGKFQNTGVVAGLTLATLTNAGDAKARWRLNITTDTTFTDRWLEITNTNAAAQEILRITGFGLTTEEMLVVDAGYDDPMRVGVFQEGGGFPDKDFGIHVVDGKFWLLNPGSNQISISTNIPDGVNFDWFWHDSYHVGEA